jgi:hypothetical protein
VVRSRDGEEGPASRRRGGGRRRPAALVGGRRRQRRRPDRLPRRWRALGRPLQLVPRTLKEMVELDAGSAGANANRCSTASSAVALGGGEHQDGDEARVFLIRGKQGSRAGVRIGGREESAHRTTECLYGVSDGPDRWKAEHVRGSLPLRVLIGSIDNTQDTI